MCPSRIRAPIRIVLHRDAERMGTKAGTSAQRLTRDLSRRDFLDTAGESNAAGRRGGPPPQGEVRLSIGVTVAGYEYTHTVELETGVNDF
jgi:hypothetical protein